MADENILGVLKKIVLDVNEASKPVNIVFGTVISESPLKIQVSQKLILNKKQLILTRNVTDYEVNMSIDHETETFTYSHKHSIDDYYSSNKETYANNTKEHTHTHKHKIKGTKPFLVHNKLKIGEKVVMVRVQEGQKYIVIDRVVKT